MMAAVLHPAAAFFSDGALRLLGVMARVAGWLPEQFWTATPADVAAVLAGWMDEGAASTATDRATLGALMEQFPDG